MEEENKTKTIAKKLLKPTLKMLLIIALIIGLVLGLIPLMYIVLKDDFERLSSENNTYEAVIDSNGQVSYVKTDEEGNQTPVTQEEMIESFSDILKDYIDGEDDSFKEKVQYLIDAEAVTKMPYIDQVDGNVENTENEGEESKEPLIGQIKFYRFNSEKDVDEAYETNSENKKTIKEEYRITYVAPDEFKTQMQNYENGGNEEVFKHFTMDDEGNVVIADGRKEERKITTGNDKYAADPGLSLEIVKENSGEEGYTGNYKQGYSFVKYTTNERKIDYLSLVEQYVMPTNFLYSLLVQTKDYDFVRAIAELAYQNEIAVGIYENESQSNMTEDYIYNMRLDLNAITTLNISKVNTEEPDAPEITENDIKNKDEYKSVSLECKLDTENGKAMHKVFYVSGGERGTSTKNVFYIKSVNDKGQATGLTNKEDASQFIVTFEQTITARSTPTVGVTIADTWIARWEATYYKEDVEPTGSSSETNREDTLVQEYLDAYEAFTGDAGNNIKAQLEEHGEKLKNKAIDVIVKNTDFSVSVDAKQITEGDITYAERISILKNLYINCSDCKTKINGWWNRKNNGGNIELQSFNYSESDAQITQLSIAKINTSTPDFSQVYSEIMNGSALPKVRSHFNEKLKEKVNQKNQELESEAQKEEEKKKTEREENFRKKLEEQIEYNSTINGKKYYVDIINKYSSSRTATTYKREETIETSEIGEKFSEVFNRSEFYDARQAIIKRDEWLWEYIQMNEDTAKLENIIKYLLNVATNSNQFGEFTEEEINDLLHMFEPKEDMSMTLESGIELLQRYIRKFENEDVYNYIYGNSSNYTDDVSLFINEEKTNYYVRTDGVDHPTVGFGIDLFNGGFTDEALGSITYAEYLIKYHGYTNEQLKNVNGSTEISTEIIDELEILTIREKLSDIRNMNAQENLQLEKYQIYALVSFSYNTGKQYKYGGYENFINLYMENWDKEKDDKYGEDVGNYDHILYKDFFYKYRFSEGTEQAGLVKRRKSEWTLFQTGYMDNIERWCGKADYPEEIRTFTTNGYTFPEYPQTALVGDINLYAKERFGYPDANRTLGSSGCGIFSMSTILSGLLGDASIDPITYRDAMEKSSIGYGYHAWNPATRESDGSYGGVVCNASFLLKEYGITANYCHPTYKEGIQALNEGKAILACEPNHYIAVVAVPEEFKGKGYEFFVIDSARGHTGGYTSSGDFYNKTGRSY